MILRQTILAGLVMPATKEMFSKKVLLLMFTFCCTISSVFSQENFFEDVLINPATCGEDNGSIEIDLPPHYVDFVWDDGFEGLNRDGLASGQYTLTGEDPDGCIETIVLEIPRIGSCELELITWQVPQPVPDPNRPRNDVPNYPCVVVGFIFRLDGVVIDPEYLDINWVVTTISPPSVYTSHQPTVRVYRNGTVVDLDVSLLVEDGPPIPCCDLSDKIILNECPIVIDPPKVYVSKSTFRDGSNINNVPGIVELLVYGDGQCGGTTDIRGYMLDDNNGQLIPPQDSTQTNGSGLNVDEGYIQFANNQVWASVPNGSIITIYESGHPLNSNLVTLDDPTDANQDFNYIVGLENSNYFGGKNSTWDYAKQYNTYDGSSANLGWQLIEANGGGDAMQVRYPDGKYCHGVSFGKTAESIDENYFALYITETEHPYCRIQMNELSYLYSGDFSVHETQGGFDPGVLETDSLIALVSHLRDCNNPLPFISPPNDDIEIQVELSEVEVITEEDPIENEVITKQESKAESLLNVYPNPFHQLLFIDYQSKIPGTGSIWIYDSQGRVIKTVQVDCTGKKQNLKVDFEDHATGLFFIQFRSPDSKFISEKALLINLD